MVTAIDKNTALVLIDLQKGILSYPTVDPIENVLQNAARLVAAFRKEGLPIVVVNVNPAGAKWQQARKEAAARQSPGNMPADFFEITPAIGAQPGDIFITKHTWSAFYETKLQEELEQRNVTGIVLGGVSTSIGVEGTARAASERGYNIAFATDAMTDIAAEAQERSFKYIFPRMGELDTTENIIKMLGEMKK